MGPSRIIFDVTKKTGEVLRREEKAERQAETNNQEETTEAGHGVGVTGIAVVSRAPAVAPHTRQVNVRL